MDSLENEIDGKEETNKEGGTASEKGPESLASDSDYIGSESLEKTHSTSDFLDNREENQSYSMADYWQYGDHEQLEDESVLNIETSLPTSESPLQVKVSSFVHIYSTINSDWMQRSSRTNAPLYQLEVSRMSNRRASDCAFESSFQ